MSLGDCAAANFSNHHSVVPADFFLCCAKFVFRASTICHGIYFQILTLVPTKNYRNISKQYFNIEIIIDTLRNPQNCVSQSETPCGHGIFTSHGASSRDLRTKRTRMQTLVAQMDWVVTGTALLDLIALYYREAKTGRPPF
ncbi:MAG: hypothetical protein LWW96_19260 [Acidovorax sp.]|uniref:hypothetical protein n=1 Tax=Acidovorax sp. TaxID=1872122 RepID=UPI0025BD9B20|nr:hypothetical protein [Acidovorax sp.]MCE1194289.1 hypothetical protein [Acidovorax sp.]